VELEAFSYSVSHDLRAPLRHIDGFADMLRKHMGDGLDDKGRRFLTTISDAAKRMGTLIDDLLLFSRMGRAEMKLTMVDLDQVLDDALKDLHIGAEQRTVEFQRSPLPTAFGDRALLRQVFVNLLSNALKYSRTRERALIEIGPATAEADEVAVYVRDNGVGFDMTYATRLFRVFQRLHRTNEFEGTGIGLANVRRIISRHGGGVWADSKVGEGATFYFSLPRQATATNA
jgi:light-regulated signal transduction histidine kinase (bacteriophytochrome)